VKPGEVEFVRALTLETSWGLPCEPLARLLGSGGAWVLEIGQRLASAFLLRLAT
jgi:hypothetical protein